MGVLIKDPRQREQERQLLGGQRGGGTMEPRTEVGQGTCFTVRLPKA